MRENVAADDGYVAPGHENGQKRNGGYVKKVSKIGGFV
jgi:hypothetical protein